VRLGNGLVKGLALCGCDAELELRGLARTVASGEGASAPGGAAVNFVEVGELGCERSVGSFLKNYRGHTKRGLVSKWHVDEAVVRQRRHGRNASALLSTTLGTGGNEQSGILAPEGALRPLSAGLVPEGLELCGKVSVASGDAEQDAVKGFELGWIVKDGHIWLGWGVHLGEDLLWEGFGDSKGTR
jgi:hypothetical protein